MCWGLFIDERIYPLVMSGYSGVACGSMELLWFTRYKEFWQVCGFWPRVRGHSAEDHRSTGGVLFGVSFQTFPRRGSLFIAVLIVNLIVSHRAMLRH